MALIATTKKMLIIYVNLKIYLFCCFLIVQGLANAIQLRIIKLFSFMVSKKNITHYGK